MKFENSKDNRIKKLAKIFNDVDTLHEYKVQADLAGISRRNYMFVFDPFVIYWIVKMHGNWPMLAIGTIVFLVSGLILSCIHPVLFLFGISIGMMAMMTFDVGHDIAKNAIEKIESDKLYKTYYKASGFSSIAL